ncbi:MAG: hypothetical protein IKM36_02350 [Oscillospiraceae bacterium]|nr:hypothetical protein [Oscillospiraceae bacterium]
MIRDILLRAVLIDTQTHVGGVTPEKYDKKPPLLPGGRSGGFLSIKTKKQD